MTTPIPADVYAAARRIYIGASASLDDAMLLDRWGLERWGFARPPMPTGSYRLAFWIVSQAMQDGYQTTTKEGAT